MSEVTRRRVDVGALLTSVEDAAPVAAADVVGEHLAEVLGASSVSLLIADLSGKSLVRLDEENDEPPQAERSAERVPIEGTPQGRALTCQELQVEPGRDGADVYAPVTNRGEAIGVLELRLPAPPDDTAAADVVLAAHALAYVVIANRRFTDLFEWGQRSAPLSLGAEIQRRLLPSAYTCEAGQATIAGWLEPAAEIAGDTFDFSLERDTLHLSITDAMGHQIDAALLATTLVGALRNGRRGGAGLADQVDGASRALHGCIDGTGFVTGQVMRIDLRSGAVQLVNAGHPLPLRLRDGRVSTVELAADPPFGTLADHAYRVQRLDLEPGDRIFLVTDGVLERNAADLDLESMLLGTADAHARDAVQHLMHALLDATGRRLTDDATAMCLDWHGGRGSARSTSAGADR